MTGDLCKRLREHWAACPAYAHHDVLASAAVRIEQLETQVAAQAELLQALATAFAGRWKDGTLNFQEGRAGLFDDYDHEAKRQRLTPLGAAAMALAESAGRTE